MLLKVSDGNGSWVMFDEVEQILFGSARKLVTEREHLDSLIPEGEEHINLLSKECFPRNEPLEVGTLEFYRNGTKVTALFASVAYILNNSGDTIEKISANGQRKR